MNEFDLIDPKVDPSCAPLVDLLKRGGLRWRGIALTGIQSRFVHFEVECNPFVEKGDGWHAGRWVGSFRHRTRPYQIVPRIGWTRFFLLATEVLSATSVEVPSSVGARSDKPMADFLALAWAIATRQGRRRHGIAKAYVRREVVDSPVLRGQLDLARQLVDKRVDRHTLACSYDDLTFDNPVNRGIRMVVPYLERQGRFPFHGGSKSAISLELKRWQDQLGVAGVEVPVAYPRTSVRWSRANDGYRTAHALGEKLIREHGCRLGDGAIDEAILVDSAEVWEMYLLRRLRDAIRKTPGLEVVSPRLRPRERDWLLVWEGRPAIQQIPDFQIREIETGRVVAVLDAKYRKYVSLPDDKGVAFQMARYSTAAASGGQDSASGRSAFPTGACSFCGQVEPSRDATPVPCALLYPRAVPDRQGAAPGEEQGKGLNPGLSPGCIGQGHFRMRGSDPRLLAWALDLPEPSSDLKPAEIHGRVTNELESVIENLLKKAERHG